MDVGAVRRPADLILETAAHFDVPDLPAELGLLIVRITRAIESLPHSLAVWDDLLPAVPDKQRDDDALAVARSLAASHGGQVRPS